MLAEAVRGASLNFRVELKSLDSGASRENRRLAPTTQMPTLILSLDSVIVYLFYDRQVNAIAAVTADVTNCGTTRGLELKTIIA